MLLLEHKFYKNSDFSSLRLCRLTKNTNGSFFLELLYEDKAVLTLKKDIFPGKPNVGFQPCNEKEKLMVLNICKNDKQHTWGALCF